MGLIRPSVSPMASPIVCVAKKNGGVRFAVDYRYLNSHTVADAYPMVTVNEILNKMGSANYINLFDAKSGYWQIPVTGENQWKTAFVTHDGLYEWTRMPFGLRNAGLHLSGRRIRLYAQLVLLLMRMLMTCLFVLVNGHSICVMSDSICR